MRQILVLIVALVMLSSCANDAGESGNTEITIDTLQGVSLFGKVLANRQVDPVIDSARIVDYFKAESFYNDNPDNPDAIIWKGRRIAYLGDFKKAIEIFTEGIKKFPEDARMYRHRGHRYISIRLIDNAISDFEIAAKLIEGTEDVVEPDGTPNIRNIPVSSLHTNIWYHLGLAYYLKGDMEKALYGFQNSLDASTNPDMHVASANWVYMIYRRMNNKEEAEKVLIPINKDMDVFENMAYHQLLLFYKGLITEQELKGDEQSVEYMNDAIAYGVGNWYYYNGDKEKAKEIYSKLIDNGVWAGFACLAAEADLFRMVVSDIPH